MFVLFICADSGSSDCIVFIHQEIGCCGSSYPVILRGGRETGSLILLPFNLDEPCNCELIKLWIFCVRNGFHCRSLVWWIAHGYWMTLVFLLLFDAACSYST